jgi:DNA-binding SARP family transcriptional activator
MLGSRPQGGALYLERQRLLRALPDSGGYVVWLHAPYGAGKSVLSAQWVAMLEGQGWRSLWLSLRGADPRPLLNTLLDLPADAPWRATRGALEAQPTVVVLEDLDGDEPLSPLLERPVGLTLLASRGDVHDPEVPRLMARGALVRLKAGDIAFTVDEARALYGERERAEAAWRDCGGWALPLHIAALTRAGDALGGVAALLRGVRSSVDASGWRALLRLSALPQLPHALADDAVRGVAAAGFAQDQEGGIALHPLLSEGIAQHHAAERAAVVRQTLESLPSALRGEALHALADWAGLEALLEREVLSLQSARVRAFDAALGGVRGPGRWLNLAYALEHEGRFDAMRAALEATLASAQASSRQRLLSVAKLLMYLDHNDAQLQRDALLEHGERALLTAAPDEASQYHLNLSVHFVNALQWAAARDHLERALRLLGPDHPKRAHYERMVRGRLATIRWGEHGDLDAILAHYRDALAVEALPATSRAFYLTYQSFYALVRGDINLARSSALEAQGLRATDPALALEASAVRAFVDGDLEAFAPICAALHDTAYWNGAWTRALWARCLRLHGQPERALEVTLGHDAPLLMAERALALAALGRRDEALEVIANLDPQERFERLWVLGARYELLCDPADLETLLGLTSARERVLPLLVSLESLPRERPELARFYPLEAVLASRWREAIGLRAAELPPLEITVMGGLEVRVLGRAVALTRRPWEVLALLLIGETRARIAEALWPDAPPDAARNNLHVTLNALRRALEPWGVPTYLGEEGLQRVSSDYAAVRAALEHRDAASLLATYRGDLAPELEASALERERAHLREQAVNLLIESAARSSDPVPALERALELDPFHEGALRALLQSLVRAGRSAHARQHYRAFEARVRAELQLEPDVQTRALVEGLGLLAHSSAAQTSAVRR